MHQVKQKPITIGASLSCADLYNLKSELNEIEAARVDFIHYDVIDGRFNDTFTLGLPTLRTIRPHTDLPIEVHLALFDPEKYIEQFVDAGADYLAVHYEAMDDPFGIIKRIVELGAYPVLALRAETKVNEQIKSILPSVDWVLKLAVHPGYSGQEFQQSVLQDIEDLSAAIRTLTTPTGIAVDGNINVRTIPQVVKAGGTILIGGSSGLFMKNKSIIESKNILLKTALACRDSVE